MRLVVTGTDTGVGKTIVSAALARPGAAYVKPAQTGDDDDAATVAKLSGAEVFTLARYPEPLAPATAARRAGPGWRRSPPRPSPTSSRRSRTTS